MTNDRPVEFRLVDAEARHRESPTTFEIPPLAARRALVRGDLVKLVFEIVEYEGAGAAAERMWVEVTSAEEGRYVGVLANEPSVLSTIAVGDEVGFGPHHVIDVHDLVWGTRPGLLARIRGAIRPRH